MKYVDFLIKAQRNLIREYKKLKQENKELKESKTEDDNNVFYSKFLEEQKKVLELKEENSKIEIELLNAKSELETRNNLIIELKARLEELTNANK